MNALSKVFNDSEDESFAKYLRFFSERHCDEQFENRMKVLIEFEKRAWESGVGPDEI